MTIHVSLYQGTQGEVDGGTSGLSINLIKIMADYILTNEPDAGITKINAENSSAVEIVLPLFGDNMATGKVFEIYQFTDQPVTVLPDVGVAVTEFVNGTLALTEQGTLIELVYLGADHWSAEQIRTGSVRASEALAIKRSVGLSLSEIAGATGTNGQSLFFADPDRGGKFVWSDDDLSAQVTTDTTQGQFIAPLANPTGEMGAWVREGGALLIPEHYGVKGGDESHDDSVAFMAMVNQAYVNNPGGVVCIWLKPGQLYHFGDGADIVFDPGFTMIYGNAAQFVFTKTCTDPDLEPQLVTNASFDSGSNGWTGFSQIQGSYQDYTFSGGQAVYEGASADAGVYGGIYQTVDLIKGEWYRLKVNAESIDNAGGQQYLSVNVRDGGPDAGGSEGLTLGPSSVGDEKTYDFRWLQNTGTYWFQVKSNNPVVVNDVSLRKLSDIFCLALDGADSPNAEQFSPVLGALSFNNLKIKSSSSSSEFGIGVLNNTDTTLFRGQFGFRDVVINGFDINLLTANRSYLCYWDGGGSAAGKTANIVLGKGKDAGENMRLSNLTISNTSNGTPGLINEGRLAHIYGCSFDYVDGAFLVQRGGYTHLVNPHFEKNRPKLKNYPMIIEGGTVKMDGGYMQLNDNGTDTLEHIYKVDKGGRLIINDMRPFGLITITDEHVTGEGHPRIRYSGIGQKTCSPFLRKDRPLNALSGSNSNGEFLWDCYASSDGTARVSQYETARIKIEPLTTGLHTSGRNGLKITKLGGFGETAVVNIAVSVPPDGMFASEFYVKAVPNPDATPGSTSSAFIQWHQGRYIRQTSGQLVPDSLRRFISDNSQLKNVDWNAGKDWTKVSQSMVNNTNANTEGEEFGEDRRTHCVVTLNLTSVPTGTEILVCDLITSLL